VVSDLELFREAARRAPGLELGLLRSPLRDVSDAAEAVRPDDGQQLVQSGSNLRVDAVAHAIPAQQPS
jgi:hypothetical protein